MREEYEERFELMKERVSEISSDAGFPAHFNEYFMEVAGFIRDAIELFEQVEDGTVAKADLKQLQEIQRRFYGPLKKENY